MFFPLICYWLYNYKVLLFYIFLLLALLTMYYIIDFFPMLGLNDRYIHYFEEIDKNSLGGLGILLFYIPLFVLIYYAIYKYPNDSVVTLVSGKLLLRIRKYLINNIFRGQTPVHDLKCLHLQSVS